MYVNIYEKSTNRLVHERKWFRSWQTAQNFCDYVLGDAYFVILFR